MSVSPVPVFLLVVRSMRLTTLFCAGTTLCVMQETGAVKRLWSLIIKSLRLQLKVGQH